MPRRGTLFPQVGDEVRGRPRIEARPAEPFGGIRRGGGIDVAHEGTDCFTEFGRTAEPIRFRAGTELRFHVGLNDWPPLTPLSIRADCPTNRVKTTGTIRVTLSNVP